MHPHNESRASVWRAVLLALSFACADMTACGPAGDRPARPDELVVFAAASLRDVFTALGPEFQNAHPGVEVTFNFAGTQELRTQLEHGARADVFASADERHMSALVQAGRVLTPTVFARNELALAVARGQEDTLRTFADLARVERLVVGSGEVPVGRYTAQLLERAAVALGSDFERRVQANVVSRELNVRQVLAKVRLGEAQAGIVYRSDLVSAGDGVRMIEIPAELNVQAAYPIARLTGAPHPELANAFLTLVLSSQGQNALVKAGFVRAGVE